ncbi:afadin isoform X3 [Sabethes cyaneus]|uniref:afadin isoform X3 n=1 Tax=Sabethes cyaneus TaxID=53552 RepID=UPI00237E52CD|nr:afadin isoform X3 [Sabethes cyaneus]XP_053682863.1 afadin isoform X3 [Sabethes cyaneus]XP_053682864.1 afadin isoform X3 [Sabethes cyaneus]XP_053682865.1 afadin isoform X3 [Sabethes cyaneus]XP_053682866.1 afadin isoform X3 [Sabethes cyaneus]XP_053682867.1 afadin isoform X3 [Sabethes cyaneus]XP_053682868.1 afadin isoform X3 [Sabethes cyaneus]XP_053682869.1 afadin isoform X3 [Sabethes cyaneus]XP_053682870.1 afadin isoform X3 [Sabethes cyaneus]XP_053682871.1 afadin isoform X3 [Sabethes cyan
MMDWGIRRSIMFHVRRRPADSQPRRRKKKPLGVSNGGGNMSGDREGPMLIEITHSGDGGRRVKLGSEPIEVGSANTNALQLFGPSIQARHCLISLHDGVCTVTPLHADGTTFVNGHHIQQPTILHNGSVVMFGRVASYRFVDSPSDGRYNLALSQSQLDSACLYESRSPTSPTSWNEEESRPISPVSSVQPVSNQKLTSYLDSTDGGKLLDQQQITKPPSFDIQHSMQTSTVQSSTMPGNVSSSHSHIHQTQNLLMTSVDSVDTVSTVGGVALNDDTKSIATADFNENDIGNTETETKSISSLKSIGSTQDRISTFPKLQPSHAAASISNEPGGQEPILPAVLEFPEQHQEAFLQAVISELDVNSPNFKLAPVYTLYLCARYRASTHYRPDLQPTERAHKLTVFLHHVANLIQNVVQEQYTDAKILSFWMANSSEFLHFLKSDRHISAFSVQAQEVLAESVQTAFRNLVSIFHVELSQTLNQFLSENIDHDSAAGLVLSVLGSAMALLRRCRVNAALTIQLFSQLFHYINVVCFNKFVTTSHMCTSAWGKALSERLSLLELWAEKQGLELAADCHLARINQCAQFLQAPKTSVTEVQQLVCSCFRLNSLQMAALLSQETIPRNLIDATVRMAESVADELSRADGREIRLEESPELHLALLLPDDGFSCDVVRGIPAGLVDFLSPFQMANMCRLASQPTSIGLWTVYMHQFNGRSPSVMSSKLPEIQIIKLHKNANGMGLSIVAAKGAGQERLGIYIKSVVTGGAADLDDRLQAGDQLLEVDGQSLIGITQERAADYLVRTGPIVTLKVAKQGAIYHGLATLLQQPSPVIQRGSSANKSRSIHNLAGGSSQDQGFYQNLSVYRAQNQSHPNLGERPPMPLQTSLNSPGASISSGNSSLQQTQQQPLLSRPASAYFNSNNNTNPNTLLLTTPTSSMSYAMPNQPQHQQAISTNISHPNLTAAAGSGTINNRFQKIQQQHQQQPNGNNFVRESQGQQSLRLNQIMAPSMPNIAHSFQQQQSTQQPHQHSTQHPGGLSASQSMQNVNMIASGGIGYQNASPMMSPQLYLNEQQQQQQQQASLLRGQAKIAEMNELIKRRNQPAPPQQRPQNQDSSMMPSPSMPQQLSYSGTSPHPSTPLASHKQQLPPTTAPKPHLRPGTSDQEHPPLPPTNTHPLFKTTPGTNTSSTINAYSSSDPPKVGFYPTVPQQSKNITPGSNPWEREEKEKETEMRREQMRAWRDQQIAELQSMPQRSLQQDEQLRTLMLDRDFEKRAMEEDADFDNDSSPYGKDSSGVQEVLRLTQPQSTISAPLTKMKQVDIKPAPTQGSETAYNEGQSTNTVANTIASFQQQVASASASIQPKSILKHNNSTPSSPSKSTVKSASFAHHDKQLNLSEITMNNTNANQMLSQMAIDMGQMSLIDQGEEETTESQSNGYPQDALINDLQGTAPPPPPPERNSSYVIMSQQQKIRNSATKLTFNNTNMIMTDHQQQQQQQQQQNIINNNSNNNNTLGRHSNNLLTTAPTSGAILPNFGITPTLGNAPVSSSNSINNNYSAASLAGAAFRDNKRVSFHDEDAAANLLNNNNGGGFFSGNTSNIGSSYTEAGHLIGSSGTTEQGALGTIMERPDPDRFIDETMPAMLHTPTTPEAESWNIQMQATPGVIGAQEVYRDPRTRRLAEQQQKQKSEPVPEKLSFKEKMKMFALESGENNTPKDKLKISRAQRDIDAVH